MKKAISLVAVVTALTVFAERQYLWPEGKMPDAQPHQFAAKEAGVLHWTRPGNHSMTIDDWREIFRVAKQVFDMKGE